MPLGDYIYRSVDPSTADFHVMFDNLPFLFVRPLLEVYCPEIFDLLGRTRHRPDESVFKVSEPCMFEVFRTHPHQMFHEVVVVDPY